MSLLGKLLPGARLLGRKLNLVDFVLDGDKHTPVHHTSLSIKADTCSAADLIRLRVRQDLDKLDPGLASLIDEDLSGPDAVDKALRAFDEDRFTILVDDKQLIYPEDEASLEGIEFIAFIRVRFISLEMLLNSTPNKFRSDIGNDLLNRMLAEESQVGIVMLRDNDIFEHHPEIAREVLSQSPDVQGDILGRIAIALHQSGPEPHILSHDFRNFGYDAERLFSLSKEIAKQDQAVLPSKDAALLLEFMCQPEGSFARGRHFYGDPEALGFHPDWEGEEFATVWPMAILKAVERNGEDTYAPEFTVLLQKLAKKWDRKKEDAGAYILAARRKVADLLGGKIIEHGPWAVWYGDERQKNDRDLQHFLRMSGGNPLIERLLSWSYLPIAERRRDGDESDNLEKLEEEIVSEGDAKLRGASLAAIHRIMAYNAKHQPVAKYNIGILRSAAWRLSRKPLTFTPSDAVDVLKFAPFLDHPGLALALARAIDPDTPGAKDAFDRLEKKRRTDIQSRKDLRKSFDYLRKAILRPEEYEVFETHDQLREGLARRLEAFALFTPSLCADPNSWHVAARAALSELAYLSLADDVRSIERHPAPRGITVDRENWVRSTALKEHAEWLTYQLPADVFKMSQHGLSTDEAVDALLQRDQELRDFWETEKYGRDYLRRHRLPSVLDACARRSAFYLEKTEEVRRLFARIEAFCEGSPRGTAPSSTWQKTAHAELTLAERKIVLAHLEQFLNSTSPGLPERATEFDVKADAPLLSFVWMMAGWPADTVAPLLSDYALRCYRSVPGQGIQAEKIGNACLWSLQALPDGVGAPYLARIATRVKYPKIKKKIDAALNSAAQEAGLSLAELEELIVPDHGFIDGVRRLETDYGSAVLTLDGLGKVQLDWHNAQGKQVKSPPQPMRAQAKEVVKAAKDLLKEVEADLKTQLRRLERSFVETRQIPAAVFVDRYLEQPLIGPACRNLIWRIDGQAALWQGDRFEDLLGAEVALTGHVTLWHPVTDPADAVVAWRDHLERLEILQPIKQAWREIYVVTDAERLTGHYSNRFAGHIVRQHQTITLARLNGWRATHRMNVDAPNDDPMWTVFEDHGIYVEYWTGAPNYDAPTLESGAFIHLHTDRVAFHRLSGDPRQDRPNHLRGANLSVSDLPEIVFSEMMRHADLIVAVASVAADPEWYDRGVNARHPSRWERDALDYYERATSGALSGSGEVRRQALERILPRLRIAGKLNLSARHVEVQGVIRSYRIHIGSGAVYRQPDGQHVCIVPSSAKTRASQTVRLPFEGDPTLSLVLSKALLLAADDKITDPVITAQIKGRD